MIEAAGRHVRDLIRAADRAALATALAGHAAHPYASLVLVASAVDASPLLLISDLAEHAKNLARDARLSLLFGTADGAGDLTGRGKSVDQKYQEKQVNLGQIVDVISVRYGIGK